MAHRTGRVFVPGIVNVAELAMRRYRSEYTTIPAAVVMHPADVAPDPPRLHGMTVVRADTVSQGQCRVVGYCDSGIAEVTYP